MSVQRTYSIYLGHIRGSIEEIQQFTDGMELDQFAADRKTNYATVRALEIIGEAVKRLPPEVRALDSLMPWREMARMRDRIIHGYDHVDLGVVWEVVQRDLPPLLPRIAALQQLLEEREDEEWEGG